MSRDVHGKFFSLWQITQSGISRDYQLKSPNVVQQFHFRAAYQWYNLPEGPLKKIQGMTIREIEKENAFETKTSPVASIYDFKIIVTREKWHYLKTKQKQITKHHLQTNHC